MLISWPPEPRKKGDSGSGFLGEGWMQGQPGRMDRGTFPSGLEGKSGAHSEARRKGSLSGTVMDVGHPDEGEKDHPWTLFFPFVPLPLNISPTPVNLPNSIKKVPENLVL